MSLKVLLIDPPYERLIGFRSEWFPLGLAYIASFLIGKGYDQIGIYHAEHSLDTEYKSIVRYSESFHKYREAIDSNDHPIWNEVREKISSFKPDLVGLSVLTAKVPSAFRIAEICKDVNPNIKVVLGGHHPTIRPDEMLSNENVDFVIRGEGEQTFYELLQALQTSALDYHTIPGLSFRWNGDVIHNKDREPIKDLDLLPSPARDRLFNVKTYSPIQLSMVMTSRGCPYNCGFCASKNMWGRKVRYRSVDNILGEIKELKNKYSIKNIAFMDDSFTIKRERVKEFCSVLIKNRIDIIWSCLTRVDSISDELVTLMKKAGCTKIDIGIESGNQRILDLINKRITLEQTRGAVKILRRHKMYWSGFFMFGFPTETEEEALDTLRFMKELRPNWANISIFAPYPNTDLYDLCREKRLIDDEVDYCMYCHQNPFICFSEKIPKERFYILARHMLKEFHQYNSSYISLLKRALTRNYHKNPRLMLQDLKKVMTWLR